jgi:hypothetical protein
MAFLRPIVSGFSFVIFLLSAIQHSNASCADEPLKKKPSGLRCGFCPCPLKDVKDPPTPFRWGAQLSLGGGLFPSGTLTQNFRFPWALEGGALVRYQRFAIGGKIGMAFGSSQTRKDAGNGAWQSSDKAEMIFGQLLLSGNVFRYRCFSIWTWAGVGLSAIDVYSRPNAAALHSGYTRFFPAGIQFKYELSRPNPDLDEAPVSVFLQYQYSEHRAFGYRGSWQGLSAGIWLQGPW